MLIRVWSDAVHSPRKVITRPMGARQVLSLRPDALSIEYVSIEDLKLSKLKLRRHSPTHYEHLANSINQYGFVLPVLADDDNKIIDGEALVEAARRVGLTEVPTVRVRHLAGDLKRALRLALNKMHTTEWNEPILKVELEYLSSIEFDLTAFTGFSSAEIDFRIQTPSSEPDDLPQLEKEVVSVRGDVWIFSSKLGEHRLACADALEAASYELLMNGKKAALTISDPPYNVPVNGHVTKRSGAREFAMANGEMDPPQFTDFLATSLRHSAAHSRDGSFSLQFIDWRHMDEMSAAGREVYGPLFNLAVWVKTNPGMGMPWRSGHELCYIWKKGTAPHVDNVQLGRHGRNRSNTWIYPGANQHRDPGAEDHVTPKSLEMIQNAIMDVSNRGDIVLDAFAGSGTTLVAAHLTKRLGYGLEIDPAYVDLAVRRMEARTKISARHLTSGLTFAEMAAERLAHSADRSAR